jgi:ACS family tartrate transporter-like MFS transporter
MSRVTVLDYSAPPASEAVLRKIAWRLIPFMILLYLLAYVDRINVGFAALQMTKDLGLSSTAYGLGAGIFFVGYFLFEIPSNLILQRTGASKWIARIMITWGLIASAMMFVKGPVSFCTLRSLLGLAEAGFFPGMLLYLTYWFPPAHRARTVALFFTATAISGVVGGPVSGVLLSMDGVAGLRGWQWLFLLEGLPSVICGVVVYFVLTDKPAHARWLSDDERVVLEQALAESSTAGASGGSHHQDLMAALADARLWLLSAIYLALTFGLYSFGYWMPTLLKGVSKLSDGRVAMLSAIPYGCAAVSMVLAGRHSDRTGERRWHAALAALTAACGFAAIPLCHTTLSVLCALSLAAIGVWCAVPPFWSFPSGFLRGTAAAGGIAAINSLGNLGGFVGPYLFGWFKAHSATYTPSLLMTACAMLVCGVLVLLLKDRRAGLSD